MADIARILTEVVLQADKAVAMWARFGAAGEKAFNQVAKASADASRRATVDIYKMGKALDATSKRMTELGRNVRNVGAGMSASITLPLGLLARQSIAAFSEAERGVTILQATLQNVGDTVKVSKDNMLDFAQTTQQSFAFSDDAVIEMQNTLLKFTDVTGKQFIEARDVILDYATASGEELPSAAQKIGQALQDPIRGLRGLREAGISLTDAQREMVEGWVQTGQKVQAQQFILEQFQKVYQGLAADFAQTDTGKLTIATNLLGDEMERLGEIIIPVKIALVGFVTDLLRMFNDLPPAVKSVAVAFGVVLAVAGPFLVVIGQVMFGLGGIISGLRMMGPLFTPVVAGFRLLMTVFSGFVGWLVRLGVAMVAVVGLWPVLIAVALGALAVVIYTYWDEIAAYTQQKWEQIKNIVAQRIEAIKSFFSALGNLLSVAWDAALNAMGQKWENLTNRIQQGIDRIKGWFTGLIDKAKEFLGLQAKAEASTGGGGGGHARGGLIRGRAGTDTIPAWLTRGEFVHRVGAVRRYGVGFMRAINQGRFPMALARGYAGGGMVGAPAMAFAGNRAGGASGGQGSRSFTLVIEGNSFGGLQAPADVADAMIKYSQQRKVRNAGRTPSWYR